jgi:hypothetical protein
MAVLNANEIFFTAYEPKVKNRFIMYVDGLPSYIIKEVGELSIENGEIVLSHINIQRKVKGKSKWGDLTMKLYDPITPSGAQSVMEWVRLHHESVTGRNGYSDFYKKDLTINVLGPVGDVISEWIIKGAFIKDAKFEGYNWEDDGTAQSIDLTLAMDYAVLNF